MPLKTAEGAFEMGIEGAQGERFMKTGGREFT